LKIGAQVKISVRRVAFSMASAFPYVREYATACAALAKSRASTLNSPLTNSRSSDSVTLLSLRANQRWRWDDLALCRMT